jgi:hypothetical protein
MSSITQDETRLFAFQLLADWRAGFTAKPNLLSLFDRLDLQPGDTAPAWVRRIWYDAVTGLAVETGQEYLARIGVPTPVRFRNESHLVAEAAERGRSAIVDPRDISADAHFKAQARAVRSFWARTSKAAAA